jgi:predicted XRE-type DNA-binding protein
MSGQRFDSVWDAIEDRPAEAQHRARGRPVGSTAR